MKRRVVVTGLGMLTPLGIGVDANWKAICAGESGVGPITKFNAEGFPVKIAGEVKGFDPAVYIEHKEIKKMDTFIHYAMACSQMALADSGFAITEENAERVGVMIGAGLGGLPAFVKNVHIYVEKGVRKITPFFIPMVIANMASGHVSIHPGLCVGPQEHDHFRGHGVR